MKLIINLTMFSKTQDVYVYDDNSITEKFHFTFSELQDFLNKTSYEEIHIFGNEDYAKKLESNCKFSNVKWFYNE